MFITYASLIDATFVGLFDTDIGDYQSKKYPPQFISHIRRLKGQLIQIIA